MDDKLLRVNNSETPWMRTLYAVRNRCSNPNNKYHKKGIKNFLTEEDIKFLWIRDKGWLLKKPSIDRINSSGNYEFKNCRFIELRENIIRGTKNKDLTAFHNGRRIKVISIDSSGKRTEFNSLAEAEIKTGVGDSCISNCLYNRQDKSGGFRWIRK